MSAGHRSTTCPETLWTKSGLILIRSPFLMTRILDWFLGTTRPMMVVSRFDNCPIDCRLVDCPLTLAFFVFA
ncbi:hypothetical protein BJX61DRAFT_508036 [Aspergillus egyptiacus]|nr:hypothetical protein BJX61DRAFT_508036 [Aspergillus egyptiacus]